MTADPAPPSPIAASRRVTLLNRALRAAWDRGWATVPSLDPDALVDKAERRTGCPADADPDAVGWRARLGLLCADLERHAALTDLGRTVAHGQLASALANRFRAIELWRRHPDIAAVPVTAPIIVVGQMRSGTTRMQRLLACDPRIGFTRFYESWNPIPVAGRRFGFDDRKLRGWLGLTLAELLNPRFRSIHPTRWHAPDEEIGLQNLSVFGSAFEAQWHVPTYTAAVEHADAVPAYHEFRRLLQTLKWLRGAAADDRPWVLKTPQFAQDVPALLSVFPDARIVYLSRDPAEIVASSASLVCNQMALQSSRVDPHRIGREWARKVALREDRMTAAKAAGAAGQVDVAYADVNADWAGQMERVYAMLGLGFDDAVRARMARYLHVSHPARRAPHRYDAKRFGLEAGSAAPAG